MILFIFMSSYRFPVLFRFVGFDLQFVIFIYVIMLEFQHLNENVINTRTYLFLTAIKMKIVKFIY